MRRFCRFWILSVLVSFAVANRIVASGGMIVISEHFASESVTNRFTQSQSDDKKMLYDRHISRGDSLMQLKQYKNAMWQFQRAAELLPFEEYPRLQMKKIEAIVGVQQLEERKRQKTADFAREDSLTREQSRVISEDITKTGVVVQKRDSVRNQIIRKYKSTLENIEATDK